MYMYMCILYITKKKKKNRTILKKDKCKINLVIKVIFLKRLYIIIISKYK